MSYGNYQRPNECPKDTPWGRWQDKTIKAEGIVCVSTASHGGFWVSPERFNEMPEYLRTDSYAGEGWFEEDCDWSLVCLSFPDLFTIYERFCAVSTLLGYHEKRVEPFKVSEAGKRIMAEVLEFKRVHADHFQTASSGSGTKPGRSWESASSIDGHTRAQWEEEHDRNYRPVHGYLTSPYTLEQINARAIPGTLKVQSEKPVFEPFEKLRQQPCA